MNVTSVEQLRTLYAEPGERAIKKQLAALDAHCIKFIELSPFLVMATTSSLGALDASPRGGSPGFVKVTSDGTILIPDSPGNNRLDSLLNLLSHGQVGLLFFIPGVDETLRINGDATVSIDLSDLAPFASERQRPKVVVRVGVREAYLHCAKALMRSGLWNPASRIDRASLPTMGEMIKDHAGLSAPAETQDEMLRRYASDL